MNRKAYAGILALSLFPLFFLAGCGSSHSTPPVVSIAATSGTPQSATVNTAFAAPLVATVTTGGSPTGGVTVTFTAPATGASGTFAGGVNTATTNASGVATTTVTLACVVGSRTVTATAGTISAGAVLGITSGGLPNTSTTPGGSPVGNLPIATILALLAVLAGGGIMVRRFAFSPR